MSYICHCSQNLSTSPPFNPKKSTVTVTCPFQKLWLVCSSLVLVWFISWTPYTLVFILPAFGYKEMITPDLDMLPAVFCKLSGAINPFNYGLL